MYAAHVHVPNAAHSLLRNRKGSHIATRDGTLVFLLSSLKLSDLISVFCNFSFLSRSKCIVLVACWKCRINVWSATLKKKEPMTVYTPIHMARVHAVAKRSTHKGAPQLAVPGYFHAQPWPHVYTLVRTADLSPDNLRFLYAVFCDGT
eukprot:SAG31_NODE_700_length_12734_cov_212.705105_4_plen_148_part_00